MLVCARDFSHFAYTTQLGPHTPIRLPKKLTSPGFIHLGMHFLTESRPAKSLIEGRKPKNGDFRSVLHMQRARISRKQRGEQAPSIVDRSGF